MDSEATDKRAPGVYMLPYLTIIGGDNTSKKLYLIAGMKHTFTEDRLSLRTNIGASYQNYRLDWA
ncbi:hypothetical protein [Sphingobacterium sp.]|uniref:hypothetical protein n=1 Tax=Sphingobacterium sp. TaxID=341027 RepID=UPI0031E191DF